MVSADWENFKRVSAGATFIMGRKSYDSADGLYSDHLNIILSRQELSLPEGYRQARSMEAAMQLVANEPRVFILGGGQVFEQSMALANYMYLTIVHHTFEGDAFFPEINWDDWALVQSIRHDVDEQHAFPFSLNEYQRIRG